MTNVIAHLIKDGKEVSSLNDRTKETLPKSENFYILKPKYRPPVNDFYGRYVYSHHEGNDYYYVWTDPHIWGSDE